jgi:hypothetical protein
LGPRGIAEIRGTSLSLLTPSTFMGHGKLFAVLYFVDSFVSAQLSVREIHLRVGKR